MIKEIPIEQASRNMLLAKDIISAQGQILAQAGALLEDKLILHLRYYGVTHISIELDEKPSPEAYLKGNPHHDGKHPVLADVLNIVDDPSVKMKPSFPKPSEALSDAASSIKEILSRKSVVQTIVRRPIFQDFTTTYVCEVNNLKSSLAEYMNSHEPMDKNLLLKETKELFEKVENTSEILIMLYNMRLIDDATYAHSVNVSLLCRVIGTWMDYPEDDLDTLTLCGLLHDIGKTEIDPGIIKKPGPLTEEEYEQIQNHPILGHKILKEQKLNKRIKLAALQHHERCDGGGYPYGLTADEIDAFALIVAIADVYDAMTANRVYREALCPFDVLQALEFMSSGFHPHYLWLFLQNTAASYIGTDAELSDDSKGKVYKINPDNISRPQILLESGEILDLSKNENIYIEKIL